MAFAKEETSAKYSFFSESLFLGSSDLYSKTFFSHSNNSTDPFYSTPQSYRVLRGGSWHYQGAYATVTSRDGPEPFFTNYNYGFRITKNK